MKKALLAGIVVGVAVLLSGCMVVASEEYVGPQTRTCGPCSPAESH